MTIRQMEILVAVSEEPSLSSAASKLFMTQAAISKAISEVSKQYDIKIFKKVNHSLVLTPEGHGVIDNCKRVLSEYYRMKAELLIGGNKRSIRLGLPDTFLSSTINSLSQELANKFPHITFTYYQNNSRYISRAISRGEIEIGVCEIQESPEGNITYAGTSKYCLVHNNKILINDVLLSDILTKYKCCVSTYGTWGRRLFEYYTPRTSVMSSTPFYSSNNYRSLIEMANIHNAIAIVPVDIGKKYVSEFSMNLTDLPQEFTTPYILAEASDDEDYSPIKEFIKQLIGEPAAFDSKIVNILSQR